MAILTPKQVAKKIERLRSARHNWDQHWQEIADFMQPRKDTIVRIRAPGEKRNTMLLDNTAMQSGMSLAGVLHSLLTNPNRIFFELTTGDIGLDEQDDVRLWLQDATRRMHNVLNNTNFQTEIHELYQDIVFFGTSAMTIEEDEEFVVRFSTKNISSIFIEENNRGIIDKVFRSFRWDAENIIAEFGRDKAGAKVIEDLNNPQPSTTIQSGPFSEGRGRFEIIQAVYPRDMGDDPAGVPERFKFVSQWVLLDEERNLRLSGFREFPYVVPRWSKSSGEIYGRGPGMAALPEAKTLNKMDETMLIGAQKVIDPPLQMPDDGFVFPIVTRPGGMNFFRPGTGDRIEPIFNDTRLDFGFQAMEERRSRIRDSFFVDQLKLREGDRMTAQEVIQRTEESMRILAPTLGRQQSELLRPLVSRVFEIMIKREMFDVVPEALLGLKLDVQYSSTIAKAQRISEGQSILNTLQAVAPFIELDPTVADNINGDAAVKAIARVHSPPQEIIRTIEEVETIREARQAAQEAAIQQQEAQQQAENVGKVAPGIAQLTQAGA